MRKFAYRAGLTIAVLLAIAGAVVTWLVTTNSGAALAWRLARPVLPSGIRVGALDGRLIGPLSVSRLRLDSDNMHATIEHAELAWHPLALLEGTIQIERLSLAGVDVALSPQARPAKPARRQRTQLATMALPFAVSIQRAAAERITIRRTGGAEPMRIGRVSLGLRLSNDALTVDQIEIVAPRFGVNGQVALARRGNHSSGGELEWVVHVPRYPAVRGTTRLYGTAKTVTVEQRVEAPYDVDARMRIDDPLGNFTVGGALTLRIAAQDLGLDLPIAAAAGRLTLSGTAAKLTVGGRLTLTRPNRAETHVDVAGSYADGTLRAKLDTALAGGHVQADIQRDNGRFDAKVEWRGLAYPQARPTIFSDRGLLHVDGALDDYRVALDAALDGTPGTPGHVRIQGKGNLRALQIRRIDMAGLDGRLVGNGSVTFSPAFAARVDLNLQNLNPGLIARGWPGRLGGHIEAAASLDNGALSVRSNDVALHGTLRERPVQLTARGRLTAPASGAVDALDLRIGGTSVSAHGAIGREVDIAWNIQSPKLQDLWPGLKGKLSTSGRISGPRKHPRLHVDANGDDLSIRATRIGKIRLAADIDASGSAASKLELALSDAVVADTPVARLDLSGSGNGASQSLSATVEAADAEAAIDLHGSVEHPWKPGFRWSFDVDRATFHYGMLPPWTLRAPASGTVTRAGADLAETCWQSVDASLCVNARRSSRQTAARFVLRNLPWKYFQAYLPSGAEAEGTVGITGELALAPNRPPRLDIDIATSPSRIGPPASDGGGGLAFAPGHARIAWDDERLGLDVDLPLEAQPGGLTAHATATKSAAQAFADSSVTGELRIAFDKLAFLSQVVRGAADTSGSLTADMRIAGTIAAPRIQGDAELKDASARLTEPNIVLEDVQAKLATADEGGLRLEGKASSGGGRLQVGGTLHFAGPAPVGQIEVSGKRFEVVGTPAARVLASPDLRLELTPTQAKLTGKVVVPEASITLPETSNDVVAVSPDQIIVDAGEPKPTAPLRPVTARIRLELGDKVSFDGLGLSGRLAGALDIVDTPKEPVSGSGELRIEQGTYRAYQQRLQIRTGRLLFAGGALSRPGLDIEAIRRPAEDILVGARIRGTLDKPELTLFSEPSMPRQEQLSYLVLGRPLESASTSEASALSQAAMMLALGGGNVLSERINQSLGFEEFGIQTKSGEEKQTEASFVIGRYVAPRLYVSYGIGLFQAVNTLRLRYSISRHWRIETESSSEGTGGDVIFQTQRGK